jgi:hypothetical protein
MRALAVKKYYFIKIKFITVNTTNKKEYFKKKRKTYGDSLFLPA